MWWTDLQFSFQISTTMWALDNHWSWVESSLFDSFETSFVVLYSQNVRWDNTPAASTSTPDDLQRVLLDGQVADVETGLEVKFWEDFKAISQGTSMTGLYERYFTLEQAQLWSSDEQSTSHPFHRSPAQVFTTFWSPCTLLIALHECTSPLDALALSNINAAEIILLAFSFLNFENT